MPSYFLHEKHDVQNNSMRGSSSPSTTIMNNNSQDLYAEVSDVTMASGLLSTFHTQQPGLQNQFSGDPEPYATTTLAMQNTNARLLVRFYRSYILYKKFFIWLDKMFETTISIYFLIQNGNLFMSLPQEDTFLNRQNCRSNIGLIENPIGTSFDISKNNSLLQKSQPHFDSLKRNQNLSNGMESNFNQQHQMKNVSSGKEYIVNPLNKDSIFYSSCK